MKAKTKVAIGWGLAMIILGTTAPAAVAASREGTYTGSTSQDRPFRLAVGGDERIRLVRITIEYENAECVDHARWDFGLSSRIRDDGTFRIKLVDEGDDRNTVVLNGEFTSRRRVEGTFRSTLHEGHGCGDLRASGTWSATRQ